MNLLKEDAIMKESSDTKLQIVIASFFSVLFVVPVLWMLMDRSPVFTYEDVTVTPKEVIQGGDIVITFTVKQNRPSCGVGTVYREFKEASGKLHIYEPVNRDVNLIDNKYTRSEKLPENISPGLTTYRGTICFKCNPIHSLFNWPICSSVNADFNVVRKPNDSR